MRNFFFNGQMRRLYACALNEFALSMMSNADVTIPYFLIFSGPSGATLYKEERLDPPEQVCFRVGYGINYVETFKYGYECLIDSNRTKNKDVSF